MTPYPSESTHYVPLYAVTEEKGRIMTVTQYGWPEKTAMDEKKEQSEKNILPPGCGERSYL